MFVVVLSGSPTYPSRSQILIDYSQSFLEKNEIKVESYSVRDFPKEDLFNANVENSIIQKFIKDVEKADGFIVSTPIYKASFTGVLKAVLDIFPHKILKGKIVLPLASAGTLAHFLALDYALKPVLSSLKAQEILHGVMAEESDINYKETPVFIKEELKKRLNDSLDDFILTLNRKIK